jgi:hypothetical protein
MITDLERRDGLARRGDQWDSLGWLQFPSGVGKSYLSHAHLKELLARSHFDCIEE